eukprot:contig_20310_g5007
MAEREQLKLEIGELSRRARELLPSLLWPLFHHKALLYRSVKTRVEVLRRLLDSNPARETLRSDALDHEQVRQAVRALYDSRDERRGFGSVVGFPGMGKTYLMRLLLDSQAAPAPAAPEDAEATFAEMMSWWMSLPVFVISFNGITTASSEDLELAGWSDKLPSLVRILYSEMMRAPDDSDFAAFCDAVLENLHDGKLTTSNVSVLVKTLLDKTEEELLSFVWQAGKTNFSAVDGVVFFKCTGSEVQPGPRHGELVVVFLQVKDKANLNMEKDVIRSAASAIESFASAADGPSWTSRSVFVVLSRRELTLQRSEDLPAAGPPILVVDEPGLQATFGPGLHALIRSSAIAFGTQVIDLTRARFSVGDA